MISPVYPRPASFVSSTSTTIIFNSALSRLGFPTLPFLFLKESTFYYLLMICFRYCKNAIALFEGIKVDFKVIPLDTREDGPQIQVPPFLSAFPPSLNMNKCMIFMIFSYNVILERACCPERPENCSECLDWWQTRRRLLWYLSTPFLFISFDINS